MPVLKDGVRMVSREDWGAAPPTRPLHDLDLPLPTFYSVVAVTHWCRQEEDCKKIVKKIQDDHMAEGYPDIQYNFLIGADGNVYEGVGWTKHVVDLKRKEISRHQKIIVAYLGKPGESRYYRRMMATQERLFEYGLKKKYLMEGQKFEIKIPDYIQ